MDTIITDHDSIAAERIVTLVKESLGSVETTEEAIADVLNSDSLAEQITAIIAETRPLAKIERHGERVIRWVLILTGAALLAMLGAAVVLQTISR